MNNENYVLKPPVQICKKCGREFTTWKGYNYCKKCREDFNLIDPGDPTAKKLNY